MVTLTYDAADGTHVTVETEPEETVLEALERAGLTVPSSCRAGVCHTCLLRARSENALPINPEAQADLAPNWRAIGYFLSCVAIPEGDLAIGPIDAPPRELRARVSSVTREGGVESVELRCDVRAFGGQQVRLRSASTEVPGIVGVVIDHSPGTITVARRSPPATTLRLQRNDEVVVTEPRGDAFYVDEFGGAPLLVAADQPGELAALGILRDALRSASPPSSIDLLTRPPAESDPLGSLSDGSVPLARYVEDDPLGSEAILSIHPLLHGVRVFLCGASERLTSLRSPLFLAGASPSSLLRVAIGEDR